jgi:hypothetical protein
MDYSIIVGVRYTGNDGAVPAMRQNSHLTPPLRAQSPTPERRNGRESNPPAEVRSARSSFDRTSGEQRLTSVQHLRQLVAHRLARRLQRVVRDVPNWTR